MTLGEDPSLSSYRTQGKISQIEEEFDKCSVKLKKNSIVIVIILSHCSCEEVEVQINVN